MFGLTRLIKSVYYWITGRVDNTRKKIDQDPAVIASKYDSIVKAMGDQIVKYKEAVGGMIKEEEKKKSTLQNLTKEIVDLEKLKSGALAKAKIALDKHNGNLEEAKKDGDYVVCEKAFRDFENTLKEKRQRSTELTEDIERLVSNINGHRSQINTLLRELDKIKSEKSSTIAEVISSIEEQKIADRLSGLSTESVTKDLEDLRDIQLEARAQARVSREISGLDNKRAQEDFMSYATDQESSDEFARLLGAKPAEKVEAVAAEPAKLPEA